jgi:hypothetical protein
VSTLTTWAPTQHDRDAFGRVTDAAAAIDPAGETGVVTLRGVTGANLAADSDVIVGVALVKPGTFNGYFEVNRENLDAWVARFGELYPDTFEPPMRLNHSWDIESVIGWFTELRVENRPDAAAGGTVVPMLVGDLRLVGTPAENAQVKAWIKSGKLSKVSSEFWPYHTNAGVEYPSVFAGAAFVDIPAAEGLGPIALRRATLDRSSSTDTPEGTTVSDTTAAPATDEDAPVIDVDDLTPDETAGADAVGDAPTATDEDAPVIGDDPEPEPTVEPVVEPDPTVELDADLTAGLTAIGANLSNEQRAQLAAEIDRRVALRVEADTRLAAFSAKGVIPLKVRDKVEALLRHPDADVRDGLAALLDVARPPVTLRSPAGVHGNEPTNADGTPTPAELSAMDFDTYTEAWAALTSAQRNAAEYLAVYREQ